MINSSLKTNILGISFLGAVKATPIEHRAKLIAVGIGLVLAVKVVQLYTNPDDKEAITTV